MFEGVVKTLSELTTLLVYGWINLKLLRLKEHD